MTSVCPGKWHFLTTKIAIEWQKMLWLAQNLDWSSVLLSSLRNCSICRTYSTISMSAWRKRAPFSSKKGVYELIGERLRYTLWKIGFQIRKEEKISFLVIYNTCIYFSDLIAFKKVKKRQNHKKLLFEWCSAHRDKDIHPWRDVGAVCTCLW